MILATLIGWAAVSWGLAAAFIMAGICIRYRWFNLLLELPADIAAFVILRMCGFQWWGAILLVCIVSLITRDRE